MPIEVKCGVCGQSFRLRDEMAGRTVRCQCGRPLLVPDPRTNVGLAGLLAEELSRPYQRPPERKAPVYVPPPEKEANRAVTQTPDSLWGQAKQATLSIEGSKWPARLRIALRSAISLVGLVYGLMMLVIGSRAMWVFALWTYLTGILTAPWSNVVYVMIALSGLLLAVASVGVLLGRKDGRVKARFSSGALVALWLVAALLAATSYLHNVPEGQPVFTSGLWKEMGVAVLRHLPWMIAPLLVFGWCNVLGKQDCKE